jgi:hypothetical protein
MIWIADLNRLGIKFLKRFLFRFRAHPIEFFAGVREVTTGLANAIPVLIDGLGQLGTATSSARFKKGIQAMEKASESILAL